MATSGTIATTTINTATLVEHALLRARVPLSAQSPEIISKSLESLYFLLLGLSNNGLNLWCVDKGYIGLTAGRATYSMPAGTLDILNVIHSQPTYANSTFSAITNGGSAYANSPTVIRVGFYFSASYTGTITISNSSDGVTYTAITTLSGDSYSASTWYYADIPTATIDSYFSVTGTSAPVSNISLITTSYDLPVSQWNRDTWAALNNKDKQNHPATNYFFEKKVSPQLTLWPVPDSSTNYLMIYRHRQIQDIGTLIQQVELPQRWLEGIIWQLALRISFEIPSADPGMIEIIAKMADKYEFEAELSETDGSPMSISPGIRGYTR